MAAQMSRVTGAFKYLPIKFLALLHGCSPCSRGLRLKPPLLLSLSREGNPDPQLRPAKFQAFEGIPHCVAETKHSPSPFTPLVLRFLCDGYELAFREERKKRGTATAITTD